VEFLRFHGGLAPFYHYYTHLYHPSCRPFRGKAGLLDDITVMEKEVKGRAFKSGGAAAAATAEEGMGMVEVARCAWVLFFPAGLDHCEVLGRGTLSKMVQVIRAMVMSYCVLCAKRNIRRNL